MAAPLANTHPDDPSNRNKLSYADFALMTGAGSSSGLQLSQPSRSHSAGEMDRDELFFGEEHPPPKRYSTWEQSYSTSSAGVLPYPDENISPIPAKPKSKQIVIHHPKPQRSAPHVLGQKPEKWQKLMEEKIQGRNFNIDEPEIYVGEHITKPRNSAKRVRF